MKMGMKISKRCSSFKSHLNYSTRLLLKFLLSGPHKITVFGCLKF